MAAQLFHRFVRAASGAVLPTFAIAAIPLVVAMGAVVDYTNAFDRRTIIQDAMDSAALAAGKKIGQLTFPQLEAEVDNYYLANVGTRLADPPALDTAVAASTITLQTDLSVPTYFLGIIGIDHLDFHLTSQATLALGTLEVALVLDNSTSMSGSKIATLKTAAQELADTLYALGDTSTKPDPVKLALVPFAASVNVGSSATWIDTVGNGTYNTDALKTYGASPATGGYGLFSNLQDTSGNPIIWGGCVEARPIPYDSDDTAPSTAGSPSAAEKKTLFVPLFAPDEPDNWTASTGSCTGMNGSNGAYLGSSGSTRRYNCAPSGNQSYNNYLPDAGNATSCPQNTLTVTTGNPATINRTNHGLAAGDRVQFYTTGSLPSGLATNTTYYVLAAGLTTNSFRISTTSGGSAINASGGQSGTHFFAQDWTCSNGNSNCVTTGVGQSEEEGFAGQNVAASSLCKYGTSAANKATVQNITVGGMPGGPNYLCTTPALTELTTNTATITNAINAMQAKGYTNIGEGFMWGWRAISPGAPFTTGRAYSDGENQKIIVLMSDGENTYSTNSKFTESFHGAYGYAFKDHLEMGISSPTQAEIRTQMNNRTLAGCQNAKTAGVKIYTIGFEINSGTVSDPATALQLLQDCASDADMYFDAQNESELLAAFQAIGDDITLLRISQ